MDGFPTYFICIVFNISVNPLKVVCWIQNMSIETHLYYPQRSVVAWVGVYLKYNNKYPIE